jgi:iron complex outermembrane recepter protein
MNYPVHVGRIVIRNSGLLRFAASLLAILVLACSLRAADAGSGSLAGSVSSTQTHNALQGAVIRLPALNRSDFTDETGSFVLGAVPAGPVDVVISYAGFADEHRTVTVRPGETTRVDATLNSTEPVVTMEKCTVESVREGQALSLTQQRNAANIKNVTAFDEWGVLPTQNIGELISRMPGIAISQQDEDGLTMSVSIGGQPGGNAGYTRMNIDGMAATGVGGDGRTATMHSFSGSMYEQVEIIAGQTPDKRADGLGGQLNLITASPLGMAERRRINYTTSMRFFPGNSERNDMLSHHNFRPDLSFNYREVFDVGGGQRNLGIMLSTAYQEIVNQHDFDVLFYNNTLGWLQDYQRSSGLNDRFISAFNGRVDYKVSPSTRVSFRFLYNAGSEPFFQYTHINPFGSANLSVYDPVTNPNGSIVPGFTDRRTEVRPTTTTSAGTTVGAARMRFDMWKVSFTSKNPTGTVTADHNFGRLKLDEAFRWSQTHWDSGAGRGREAGELQMRTRDPLGFILDYSNPTGKVFTQTNANALNIYDPAAYSTFLVTAKNLTTQPTDQTSTVFLKRDNITNTNEVSANANASYLLPTEVPITIKSGLDTINRRVNAWVPFARRWYGVTGSSIPANSGLVPLTEFERLNTGGQRLPVFDPAAISTTLNNPALWTEDLNYNAIEKIRSTRILEEGVDAAYLMGTVRLGRFSAVTGVRGEWVKTHTKFYTAAPAAKRTPIAVEPDPLLRAYRDYLPSVINGRYHKFFPSLHLAYDVTSNIKARASFSNSYGRPRLQDLVSSPTAVDPTSTASGTVTVGNPKLKPATANNVDFRLDYAFAQSGFITARWFKKDIHDYIGSSVRSGTLIGEGPDNGFDGQYVGYELIQPGNIGSTRSEGIELDYRQQLTFLPGALKGLSLRANYTNVRTWAMFNNIIYGPGQVVGSAGQWYVPRAYNVGLTYTYRKFTASWDMNYNSQFPEAFSFTSPTTNIYRLPRYLMNVGFTYKIRPEATMFLSVANLEENDIREFRYIESRHYRQYNTPRSVKVGVTGQF